MFTHSLKPGYFMGAIIVALVFITAGAGFLNPDQYRPFAPDALWVGLPVQDAVSLVCAGLLAAAMVYAGRGSARATVLWGGLLVYVAYYYAFYCFGYVYTVFYPLYLALMGLGVYALIELLVNIDLAAFQARVRPKMPVRVLAVVLGMTVLFIPIWLSRIFQGIATQHTQPADLVFVLDLAFLIPAMVYAAVQIWRRRPFGYLAGGVLLVKAALSGILLTGGSLRQLRLGYPVAREELALYVFLAVVGLAALMLYLWNLRDESALRDTSAPRDTSE